MTPSAGGQSKAETGRSIIRTAIDEIKYSVGSVRLQSSARACGKLAGLAARNRLPPSPPRKKRQKILLYFFLTEVKTAFGQNWKRREFGGFVFLTKNQICFENYKPLLCSENCILVEGKAFYQ